MLSEIYIYCILLLSLNDAMLTVCSTMYQTLHIEQWRCHDIRHIFNVYLYLTCVKEIQTFFKNSYLDICLCSLVSTSCFCSLVSTSCLSSLVSTSCLCSLVSTNCLSSLVSTSWPCTCSKKHTRKFTRKLTRKLSN